MMMHGMFILYLSLALGYALCVSAGKQKGNIKTLGYSLGISIIALTLIYGVIESNTKMSVMKKYGMKHRFGPKICKSRCQPSPMMRMK